eukprot:gene4573-5013_t
MNASIDISTHEIAELTAKAMNGKVTLEEVLSVWHEIGNVVKQQMTQRKAVRLSSFGTFGFSLKQEPIFTMATEFGNQFKIRQRGQVTTENVPTSSVNFAQIKAGTGIEREVVEKIYMKFMTALGRVLFEGRSVLLTIHRVAEIQMTNNELTYSFMPDFLMLFNQQQGSGNGNDRFKKTAQKTSSLLKASKMFEEGLQKDQQRQYNTSLDIGRDDPPLPRGSGNRGVRPVSAGRNNPFSSTSTILRNERPTSAGRPQNRNNATIGPNAFRRPMSASTTQSTVSTTSSAYGTPRNRNKPLAYTNNNNNNNNLLHRPSSRGLNIDNNNMKQKHAATTNGRIGQDNNNVMDARRLAAKALDVGDIVDKVRNKIVERGGSNGLRSIAKLLSIMDDNGDKRLSRDELRYGLRDYGINLTPTELEQVFLYFDRDRNGFIDITEFLIGIRGDLNNRRKSLVQLAFNILDTDHSGVITVDEILTVYDLNWHPEVRAELGMKGRDREDIRGRLARQGVDAQNVDLYGGYEDVQQAKQQRNKGGMINLNRPSGPAAGQGRSRSNGRSDSNRVGGGGQPVTRPGGVPREAWAEQQQQMPGRGDQSSVPSNDYSPRPSSSAMDTNTTTSGFDAYQTLHQMLYSPPCSLETLCLKLQVSSVNTSPRIAQGAFIRRLSTLDPCLNRQQLTALWNIIDPQKLGSIEVIKIHNLLSDRYGKDKTSQKGITVIERVIKKILERCGEQAGIKGLARILSIMDSSGDHKLSKEELKYGLLDYGVELNLRELDDLFTYFDRDHNGLIDIDELLIGVRGDLNDRRRLMVQMAFNILDTDRSGFITVDEIMERYNFQAHPDVIAGKKTPQEAAKEFMRLWDRHSPDELGMKGRDREDIRGRLARQGVDAQNVDLYGGYEDVQQAKLRSRPTNAGVARGRRPAPSQQQSKQQPQQQQQQQGVSQFERNVAAMKLAAAYRGRLGRKQADSERRKLAAEQQARQEEQEELNRPKPREILRPKGRSYIGF